MRSKVGSSQRFFYTSSFKTPYLNRCAEIKNNFYLYYQNVIKPSIDLSSNLKGVNM